MTPGRPGRRRKCAGLANDIREWGQYGDSAALAIVMNNAGESINAFGDFWRRYFPLRRRRVTWTS